PLHSIEPLTVPAPFSPVSRGWITRRGNNMRHCDEYIDDPDAPECLRTFLEWHRRPAIEQTGTRPTLFATYVGNDPLAGGCYGRRCRVVMASRFGDVGVRFTNLSQAWGYSVRCWVGLLKDFSDSPDAKRACALCGADVTDPLPVSEQLC